MAISPPIAPLPPDAIAGLRLACPALRRQEKTLNPVRQKKFRQISRIFVEKHFALSSVAVSGGRLPV
jgi:hypothetical protein